MINIFDDQRRCIFPVVTNTWAEEGKDPLREQTLAEGVDVGLVHGVKEGHSPVLIVYKNSDNFWLLFEGQKDRGRVQRTILVSTPQPHRPVAVLRLGGNHPLPVDGLSDHSQVPEGLCPDCNLIEVQMHMNNRAA